MTNDEAKTHYTELARNLEWPDNATSVVFKQSDNSVVGFGTGDAWRDPGYFSVDIIGKGMTEFQDRSHFIVAKWWLD